VKLFKAPTLFHFHDPELLPIGLWLKRKGHVVIYDVHEDVPADILAKEWIPTLLRTPIAKAVRYLEAQADSRLNAVLPVTSHIAQRFSNVNKTIVQNFPGRTELGLAQKAPFEAREDVFFYVGDLQPERGITQLVKAAAMLNGQCQLWLAGPLSDAYKSELSALEGWKNTRYLGVVDRGQLRELLNQVKVGMVPFLARPNHINAQPNKLFEYMSAGLPMVASDFPLWRSVIEGAGVGLVNPPEALDDMVANIRRLTLDEALWQQFHQAGPKAVQHTYNWEQQATFLVDLYTRLMEQYG
jgi:glycosyltransferase involved in cell wall biosynthesis